MALTALAATTAAIVQATGFDEPGDVAAAQALVRAIRAPAGFERLMSLEAFPGVVAAEAAGGTRSGWAGRDARDARGGGSAKAVDVRRASDFFVFADDPCLDRLAAASRLFCVPRDVFLATIPDWT